MYSLYNDQIGIISISINLNIYSFFGVRWEYQKISQLFWDYILSLTTVTLWCNIISELVLPNWNSYLVSSSTPPSDTMLHFGFCVSVFRLPVGMLSPDTCPSGCGLFQATSQSPVRPMLLQMTRFHPFSSQIIWQHDIFYNLPAEGLSVIPFLGNCERCCNEHGIASPWQPDCIFFGSRASSGTVGSQDGSISIFL